MLMTGDMVDAMELMALNTEEPPGCEGNHVNKEAHDYGPAKWMFDPGCGCPVRLVCEGWHTYFRQIHDTPSNRRDYPMGHRCPDCSAIIPWDVPVFLPLDV